MMHKLLLVSILLTTCIACKQSNTEVSATKDISVEQAAQLHSEGYVYIDLRTKEEMDSEGIIPGALTIDYRSSDFDEMISKLPKNSNYIAYCAGGGRSAKSLSTFEKYGLNAYNMLGGYSSWIQSQK